MQGNTSLYTGKINSWDAGKRDGKTTEKDYKSFKMALKVRGIVNDARSEYLDTRAIVLGGKKGKHGFFQTWGKPEVQDAVQLCVKSVAKKVKLSLGSILTLLYNSFTRYA